MWKYIEHVSLVPHRAIAIVGFPGMGLVGKTVVAFLIRALNMTHVGTIYGTRFPAHLLVNASGLGDINRVDVYAAERDGRSLLVITGDAQPMSDADQHSLARFIASRLKRMKVAEVIAAAAYVSDVVVPHRRVFVVGTSTEVIGKYVREGAVPLSEGYVSGLNGIIVGWAKVYGIDGVCLLGETWRSIVEMNYVDYSASRMILEVLKRVWGLEMDTGELEEKGRSVEREIEAVMQRLAERERAAERREERRPPYYIT